MPNWKKVAVSGSAASFSSLYVDTSVTASIFSGSQFIGNLSGTASNALTSSYVNPLQQDAYITGALSITGAINLIGDQTSTGNRYLTGSWSVTGSAMLIGNNTLVGNTVLTGSLTVSASSAVTVIGGLIVSGTFPVGGVSASMVIDANTLQRGYVRFDPVTSAPDNSISASYIYVSGSTNDLYFAQNSQGFTNATRLRWIEGNLYTGLLSGGTIATASSTVYTVSSGSGIIVSLNASLSTDPYPTVQYLNWGTLSASIAPLSASYDQAFVGVDSTGNLFQQGAPFNDGQFDALINIGAVFFQNNSTINGVKTQPSVAYGFEQRQSIFTRAFGPLKLSGFTVAVSGSSTGSVILGSGTAYADGANYIYDPNDPSYVTDPGTNTSKFWRYYDTGSDFIYDTNNGTGYPNLDPVYYSNNGTLSVVGTGNYSIQRLFWFPNSVTKAIIAYYGNARYGTMSEAIANLNIEPFVEAPNTAANAIYLGAYAIKGGTNTSLQNPAHFTWIPGGLFRSVGGSGGGGSVVTQTLAGLSDVSILGQTDGQPLAWSATAGKWINSTYISASVAGNATSATSASYASTSSWALNAITASYVLNAVSSSRATSAATASYVLTALTASYVLQSVSASFASTASSVNTLNQAVTISGSLGIAGNAGTTLLVSNADTLVFSGSAQYTGSFGITGSLNVTQGITGSLLGTASTASYVANAQSASYVLNAVSSSYALTASYALNAGGGGGGATTGSNVFEGDQTISGSLYVTGSASANIFLYPQTASNVVIPSGYNGLLITPIQLQGSSSVAIGSRLTIL